MNFRLGYVVDGHLFFEPPVVWQDKFLTDEGRGEFDPRLRKKSNSEKRARRSGFHVTIGEVLAAKGVARPC